MEATMSRKSLDMAIILDFLALECLRCHRAAILLVSYWKNGKIQPPLHVHQALEARYSCVPWHMTYENLTFGDDHLGAIMWGQSKSLRQC